MHYSSSLHLIKLRFGHIKRGALCRCRLRRRRLGQRLWARCEKSSLTQICYWQTSLRQHEAGQALLPHEPSQWQSYRGCSHLACFFFVFVHVKIQSRCSTSNSCWPEKTERLWLYLLLQRLKNFALISASDSETSRRSPEVDRQWFGAQSPSPILHKGPNTLCPGVGTLFRSGRSHVNCLNKSWEEPLKCLQASVCNDAQVMERRKRKAVPAVVRSIAF